MHAEQQQHVSCSSAVAQIAAQDDDHDMVIICCTIQYMYII